MNGATFDLTALEIRVIRAAVLEAITDEVFDRDPALLARSEHLLSELSARSTAAHSESTTPGAVSFDGAALEVVDLSLAHVAESIEEWELPIRVGLARDGLGRLGARFTVQRRGGQ